MKQSIIDALCMKQFNNKNERAMKRIFEELYPALTYYANRFIHNSLWAEDIVTDIFIKAFNSPEKFKSYPELKSFLYTCVRNKCYDEIAKKTNNIFRQIQFEYLHKEDVDHIFDIDFEILNTEIVTAMYHEINNLPPRCREIFTLRIIHGMDVKQVSDKLKASYQTVCNQTNIAIRRLRSILTPIYNK